MAIDPLWNRVRDRWHESNVREHKQNTEATITAFESRYGVALPDDVRSYFTTLNGFDDMDNNFYRFWSLEEVMPVHDVLDGDHYRDRYCYPGCFVFADFSISSWLCAVRLTSDARQPAPVFQVTASFPPGPQLSASFREFIEQYVVEPISG